jgi:predicted site-specific integrase-resolvase
VKQAAAELGINAYSIYDWIRSGQTPARHAPSGRWCIPWDPATQAIYRHKVETSTRLHRTPTTPPQEAV